MIEPEKGECVKADKDAVLVLSDWANESLSAFPTSETLLRAIAAPPPWD